MTQSNIPPWCEMTVLCIRKRKPGQKYIILLDNLMGSVSKVKSKYSTPMGHICYFYIRGVQLFQNQTVCTRVDMEVPATVGTVSGKRFEWKKVRVNWKLEPFSWSFFLFLCLSLAYHYAVFLPLYLFYCLILTSMC